MARFKYFTECNGVTVELGSIYHDGHASTAARHHIGTCPECLTRHNANRMIEMKASPSKHECDDRCINATGRVMKCECSCGGKNHGRGAFNCSAVAA